MSKFEKPLKVTIGIEFATSEAFGGFCEMLTAGGYDHVVKGMAKAMLAEAERRNLPISKKIKAALKRAK